MTVFPGGGLDPRDRAPLTITGPSPADWARTWGVDDEETASALVCAAVRETFEETGVLLAGPTATTSADAATVAGLATDRAALAEGTTDLATTLTRAGLVLRSDLLVPWARWITPGVMPKRYDARFFLALVPAGQEADGATSEAQDSGWSTPAEAVEAWTEGRRQLMPPTWAVLGGLAEYADTAALWAAASGRQPVPVTPTFLPGDDRVGLAVPGRALGAGA